MNTAGCYCHTAQEGVFPFCQKYSATNVQPVGRALFIHVNMMPSGLFLCMNPGLVPVSGSLQIKRYFYGKVKKKEKKEEAAEALWTIILYVIQPLFLHERRA